MWGTAEKVWGLGGWTDVGVLGGEWVRESGGGEV